jgi:hypothetical protein
MQFRKSIKPQKNKLKKITLLFFARLSPLAMSHTIIGSYVNLFEMPAPRKSQGAIPKAKASTVYAVVSKKRREAAVAQFAAAYAAYDAAPSAAAAVAADPVAHYMRARPQFSMKPDVAARSASAAARGPLPALPALRPVDSPPPGAVLITALDASSDEEDEDRDGAYFERFDV